MFPYQAQALDEQVLLRRTVDVDAARPECIIFRGVFLQGNVVGENTSGRWLSVPASVLNCNVSHSGMG